MMYGCTRDSCLRDTAFSITSDSGQLFTSVIMASCCSGCTAGVFTTHPFPSRQKATHGPVTLLTSHLPPCAVKLLISPLRPEEEEQGFVDLPPLLHQAALAEWEPFQPPILMSFFVSF